MIELIPVELIPLDSSNNFLYKGVKIYKNKTVQKNKSFGLAAAKAQAVKSFLASKSFRLSIGLLIGLLGLVLALGWVNPSFAYASELEGEIAVTFETGYDDRSAVRLVVEGDHIAIVYYRGQIVEGEKTICSPIGKARFELVPATGYDAEDTKIFNQYTENDKIFYLTNDNYDYVCFMVVWGTWDDNSGISYGPYRMGSDVTADNYDDLLEQEEEEEIIIDNPPVLAVSQSNTVLSATATDDNLDSSSWQNAGPSAGDLDCESEDLTYNSAGSDQHTLTLTTADNGQWYCFKVSDTGNNTNHIKHRVTGVIAEEETGNNNNPDPVDTSDADVVNNDPDPIQDVINNQEEDSNNGGSVSRQDTGSGGDPQESAVATTPPVEPALADVAGKDDGTSPDITDTGIIDKQGWLQLLGVVIVLVAALGFARLLIMKKHRQT